MRRRFGAWLPVVLLIPAAAIVLCILVLPLGQLIGGTSNGYGAILSDGYTRAVLWRTVRVAALSTAIAAILGFPTAYVVARSSPARRGLFLICAVFPLLTNPVVRSFAWIVILGRNGLINQGLVSVGIVDAPIRLLYTETAMVIGFVYLFLPLMILSLVGVLEGIERDLLDAAASLGAGPLAVFGRVVLPLAVPGLIVGCVLVFTGSFTAYTTPQLLGGDRNTVLATLLYRKAMVQFDWGGAAAISAIMIALTVLVIVGFNQLAKRLNPVAG
jgi:putative spermidine/putrescine transport system permease protein